VGKPTSWSTERPTRPGKYRLRDPIFGWGPVDVIVDQVGSNILVFMDDTITPMDHQPKHLEWRFVAELNTWREGRGEGSATTHLDEQPPPD